MVVLFDRVRSFGRDAHGAVREEGDTRLASQISWLNPGDQWGDRCPNQIALTPTCQVLDANCILILWGFCPNSEQQEMPRPMSLQGETHRLEGISPLCPPLPGKATKLLLSALPKTVSLRFNPTLVHRGWISAVMWLHSGDPHSAQSHEKKTICKLHSLRSCHSSFSSSPQSTFFCLCNEQGPPVVTYCILSRDFSSYHRGSVAIESLLVFCRK